MVTEKDIGTFVKLHGKPDTAYRLVALEQQDRAIVRRHDGKATYLRADLQPLAGQAEIRTLCAIITEEYPPDDPRHRYAQRVLETL